MQGNPQSDERIEVIQGFDQNDTGGSRPETIQSDPGMTLMATTIGDSTLMMSPRCRRKRAKREKAIV